MKRTRTLEGDSGLAAGRLRSLMGRSAGYTARQEEILDALEKVFLARGFLDVSVTDLVAAAHCSRRTLYELAPTKEQLFLLVADRMWRRLDAYAREAARQKADAATRIEAFLVHAAEIFRAPSAILRAIQTYAPARRIFDDHIANYIDFIAELVSDGIRAGEFRSIDPHVAAEVLAAAAAQVAGRDLADPEKLDGAEAVGVATRLALFGLIDPTGPGWSA